MDNEPTRRRGPMFWLADRSWRLWVAIALPVCYVGSFGPYLLLVKRNLLPRSLNWVGYAYHPLIVLVENGPEPFRGWFIEYLQIWQLLLP